jgi:MFS family permease
MQLTLSLHLPPTFRALRHYNYRLWFIGQGISLIGVWMQSMAQQVLVYRLTGSAAALGMVNFISLIPLIPLSLLGGSITDRFSRRNIIIITQVVMMVQALLLAWLSWTGLVRVWHVYVLSLLLGMVNAVDVPARQAFTVDMVEGKEDLTNAIGLNSAMFNGARAIGPAAAGLMVAATGEGTAFLINALTFVAVLISLAAMKNLPAIPRASRQPVDMGRHILEGLGYIARRRAIAFLVSLIAISAFLSMPYSTLMPVFASSVLNKSAEPVVRYMCETGPIAFHCKAPEALPLGMLLTTVGIGALIGALVVASLPETAHRGRMLTLGNLAFPLLLFGFAVSRSFLLSLFILLLVGVSFVWQNALANTLLQVISPDELRGRIMSVYTMVFQSMMRLGGLQAGLMADWVSAPFSVGIGALLSLLYGVYILTAVPEVRRME